MYDNKKIFILGMARSGYEACKVLIEHHCQVLITDMKEQEQEKVSELENLGARFVLTDKPDELLNETYDYVVKNPGIKIEHPVCLKAATLGIKIINEIEIGYNYLPKDITIIGVTGSNGKTTTTTLIYEFLKANNSPVYIGGNIGFPLCSLVNKVKSGDILVLEISGHQLHDTLSFKTNISVMTNLSEVHLDHFGTYENYKKNKAYIFRHLTQNDLAVVNGDDKDVMDIAKTVKAHQEVFSSKSLADIYIKENAIYYHDELIINLKDIRIKGLHNYENIMCAIAVCKHFSIKNATIHEVCNNFAGVEHRIEFVKKVSGREFYNDSKSTNVKSTQTALKAFTKPVILLLGGLDRGHSFEELAPYLNSVKSIICYGETKERIKTFATLQHIECFVTNTLNEAVKIAYNISNEGDVILLSPACASWDQYNSFEERGNAFKECVNNLPVIK